LQKNSELSFAGLGVIVLLGGIILVVTTSYNFVVDNLAAIVAALVLTGAIWLIFRWLSRVGKSKPQNFVNRIEAPESDRGMIGPTIGRKALRRFQSARWVDPGEPIRIRDFEISCGLFYLGEVLALPDGTTTDQYVINPKLAVSPAQADVGGRSIPYWPSYASTTPSARRALLEWMAAGRNDPAYGISYVFLFLYGLEHRQFIERNPSTAPMLISEVERLLSIYGQNHSFRRYATNFLIHARLATGLPLDPPPLSPGRSASPDLPLEVRLYLGEKLAASNVLSAHDTLVWVLASPDTYLRTPAIRCFDEFVALWTSRFAEKYPSGFQVKVPTQKITLTYRACSGTFQVDVAGPHTHYPDIAAERSSLEVLQSLAHECTDDLDGFSRFIGRRPERKSSVQAALLLPKILQRDASTGPLRDVGQRITSIMGSGNTAATKMREILKAAAFDFPETGKLPQVICDQLGEVLDRIDVAIEPDRRYDGGGAAQIEDQVVIFRADQGGAIDPKKPSYQQMKVQVEVAALAGAADGPAMADYLQTIIANIKAAQDLTRTEGLRLIAYAITIFNDPAKQERIMRRLAECGKTERQAIALAALSLIGSHLDPKRVGFLERLNKALRLPKDKVYADLHRALAAPDGPIIVSPGSRIPGVPIPKQPKPIIQIDPGRLAKVQKQTQAVAAILTQIFVDDDGSKTVPKVSNAADASPFKGLDRGHAELVEYMEIKGKIPRQEFDQRAKALKLLPAGAIEKINEWSFDQFDEPLLEEGKDIVLCANLRDRLAELSADGS
jgi:TerB N-terminal domain/TerB-C domain